MVGGPLSHAELGHDDLRGVSSATVGEALFRGLGLFGGLAFFASTKRGVVAQALVSEDVLFFLVEDADGVLEVVELKVEVDGQIVVDRLRGFLDR